jgi:hypothetical protein
MPASINAADLSPDQKKELGIRAERQTRFTQDEVRGYALKVLALMANLTRAERARVLRHAQKVNKV